MATTGEHQDYNENLQSQTSSHKSIGDLEGLAKIVDLEVSKFLNGMESVSDDEGRFKVTDLRRYLNKEYSAQIRDTQLQSLLSAVTNHQSDLSGAYEGHREYDQLEYEINI